MTLPRNLSVPRGPRTPDRPVCCDVAGHGTVQAAPDLLPGLRQNPGPPPGVALPASFLKHADEQTVAGLTAVFRAVQDHGLRDTPFTDWAILGAPRFMGRGALAVALQRYQLEGAWGISPHLIPHRSLHSVSGTVSQALAVHGPNFGVSGGRNAADEALLIAAALLAGNEVPGVWVVLTGYQPEPIPERPGTAPAPEPAAPRAVPVCRAVALALVAGRPGSRGLKLHVAAGPAGDGGSAGPAGGPWFSLEDLLHALHQPAPAGSWRLHCGGRVELNRSGAGAEN